MATIPQGNRRIDRVLADDYLARVSAASMAELREMRREAEQEETDLSYIRRLVQGRVDIIRAELARRERGETGSLTHEDLPAILAETDRPPARGLGKHATIEPSRADEHRRYVEQLVADVDLSDVGARETEELQTALEALGRAEAEISANRRRVFDVVDACSAELTRRYRDGEADVADLLGSVGE